jgi:hypothetical protein
MNRDVVVRGGDAILVSRPPGGVDFDRKRAGSLQILRNRRATGGEQDKEQKSRLTHRGRPKVTARGSGCKVKRRSERRTPANSYSEEAAGFALQGIRFVDRANPAGDQPHDSPNDSGKLDSIHHLA